MVRGAQQNIVADYGSADYRCEACSSHQIKIKSIGKNKDWPRSSTE